MCHQDWGGIFTVTDDCWIGNYRADIDGIAKKDGLWVCHTLRDYKQILMENIINGHQLHQRFYGKDKEKVGKEEKEGCVAPLTYATVFGVLSRLLSEKHGDRLFLMITFTSPIKFLHSAF